VLSGCRGILLGLLVGEMAADNAAADGPEHGVMAGVVAGDAADEKENKELFRYEEREYGKIESTSIGGRSLRQYSHR